MGPGRPAGHVYPGDTTIGFPPRAVSLPPASPPIGPVTPMYTAGTAIGSPCPLHSLEHKKSFFFTARPPLLLSQNVPVQPRLATNSPPSCLSLGLQSVMTVSMLDGGEQLICDMSPCL